MIVRVDEKSNKKFEYRFVSLQFLFVENNTINWISSNQMVSINKMFCEIIR